MTDIQSSAVQSSRQTTIANEKMRVALLVLAIASVLFPAVTIKAMGMFSQGVGLPLLVGGIAYVIPLAFAAALAAPFMPQLQSYSRIIDLAAAAICVLFLLWGLWSMFDAYSAMAQQDRALSSLMGANTAGLRAPRVSDFGSFSPSIGAFALLATAVLSVFQARKALKAQA